MTHDFILLTRDGSDEPDIRVMVRHLVCWAPDTDPGLSGSYVYTGEDPTPFHVAESSEVIDEMIWSLG